MDIFEWKKCCYLLMVDYYSRFVEMTRLGGLSTEAVIGAVKGIFARHGVPEEVVSDKVLSFLRKHFRASVGSMVLNTSIAAHFIHSPMGKQRGQ